jgi:hypothetical protein
MSEKRQFERAAFDGVIEVLAGDDRFQGRVRDLSVGGVYVVSDRKLAFGQAVKVALALPALTERGKPAAVVDGIVRWVREDGFGVQFGTCSALATYALADYVARRTHQL